MNDQQGNKSDKTALFQVSVQVQEKQLSSYFLKEIYRFYGKYFWQHINELCHLKIIKLFNHHS